MTKGEQDLITDLNEFVRQTADLTEDVPQTSGIRPHPVIEETETTLETTRFGFEFGPQPESESEPGGPPAPPEPCVCDSTWTCPGGCTPPSGSCIHYIQFQVRLTQCDIDNDFSLLFQFNFNADPGAFNVFSDSAGWHFRINGGDNIDISATDVPIIACHCYDVLVAFDDPGGTDPINVTLCVNGVSATGTLTRVAACATITDLFVGDPYGGNAVVNRKYRHFVASPGFDMDTDSFDSLVRASIISEGANVLLVNSGSNAGYGEKNISWVIACSGC